VDAIAGKKLENFDYSPRLGLEETYVSNIKAVAPRGFAPLKLWANPFIDSCGPLYGKREDGHLVLGLRVESRHCNPAGSCHGGMLMTFADMLLVLGANAQTGLQRFMTTVNLTCDFIGPVPEGVWLEGRMEVLKATRSLVFTQGSLDVEGQPVVRVNGILKPTGESDPRFSVERYFA
jgi:uncharacterized protein (TIGR00369 family)